MSTLADRTIAALRTSQDDLAARVANFTDADLDLPSGAAEWDVAQVLSHLGSAAQIGLAGLSNGLAGASAPDQDFNIAVWDRWNALSQRGKADGFLTASEELVAAYEALDGEQRRDLKVQLGFLPFPADVTLLSGMRLNEFVLHSWDVRVAFDPAARLPRGEAAVLLEQFQGPMSFLVGFTGKVDVLDGEHVHVLVHTTDQEQEFGLALQDSVSLGEAHEQPHVVLSAETETVIRLLAGRLSEQHTPDSLTITGDAATIEQLRQVFPGY
ncbi:MAG: maleylpyruvate isomerase family mycothiol-dependent enzyme [Actinomycetes bacterium]